MAEASAASRRKSKLGSISALMSKVEKKPIFEGKGNLDLPVSRMSAGRYQPRRTFDEASLSELAESIKVQGVIQPIIVRPVDEGYEIIAGERRWRAAQLAGLETIPAIVREVDDQTALAMALIENIQREDLDYREEAESVGGLKKEFGLKNKEVAKLLGKSEKEISLLLGLLSLPKVLEELYGKGTTSPQILAVLSRCLKSEEELTLGFIVGRESITYSEAIAFQKKLKEPKAVVDSVSSNGSEEEGEGSGGQDEEHQQTKSGNTKEVGEDDLGYTLDNQNVTVFVEYLGEQWQLDLVRKDDDADFCWIKRGSDALRVEAKELKVLAVQ